jgi:hypothetical protein
MVRWMVRSARTDRGTPSAGRHPTSAHRPLTSAAVASSRASQSSRTGWASGRGSTYTKRCYRDVTTSAIWPTIQSNSDRHSRSGHDGNEASSREAGVARSRDFSVYLLKEGVDAASALKDEHSLYTVDAGSLPTSATVYVLDGQPRPLGGTAISVLAGHFFRPAKVQLSSCPSMIACSLSASDTFRIT